MNPYKTPNVSLQGPELNRVPRRKYNTAISAGLLLIVFAVAVYAISPMPQAIDIPWPESWETTKLIGNALLFTGATIIWLTGAAGFVYSDMLWQGLGYLRYLAAMLVGLPISLILGIGYLL